MRPTSPPPSDERAPNIVLIGLSGSGKSTLARYLAERLGWRGVDTDALIEQQSGSPISAIFAERGENSFRRLEAETIARTMADDQQIVATGGGAILLPENRERLWRRGLVVYLKTSPDVLVARLTRQGADDRPLLHGDLRDRLESLLTARSEYYEQAHVVVPTDGMSLDAVAETILDAYQHSS